MTKETSFLTAGVTIIIAGKAIINAKDHALSQMEIILGTNPTLKMLITSDIRHDMSNDIKKEKTKG
jgi:hypothetical protein